MDRKWLFLCATRPEWGLLKRKIPFERASDLGGLPCYHATRRVQGSTIDLTLCQTGIGYRRIASLAPTLLGVFDGPLQMVVHFGLAGALVSGLKTGDLVVVSQVKNEWGDSLALDPYILKKAGDLLDALHLPFREGALLTSEVVLKTKSEKEMAGHQFDAIAVDMETFPMAHQCQKNRYPFLAVRSIFDPLDLDLSGFIPEYFLDHRGNLSPWMTARSLVKSPHLLLQLPSFQKAVSIANKGMTQFLVKAIHEWI